MHKTSFEKVLEFHRALDLPVAPAKDAIVFPDELTPGDIDAERKLLRLKLIAEECAELCSAIIGLEDDDATDLKDEWIEDVANYFYGFGAGSRPSDLIGVADGACDLHVVVSGTCVEYGIPEDDCYDEVQRANLSKAGGPMRADGKQLKPEGWMPPDHETILRQYGWEG